MCVSKNWVYTQFLAFSRENDDQPLSFGVPRFVGNFPPYFGGRPGFTASMQLFQLAQARLVPIGSLGKLMQRLVKRLVINGGSQMRMQHMDITSYYKYSHLFVNLLYTSIYIIHTTYSISYTRDYVCDISGIDPVGVFGVAQWEIKGLSKDGLSNGWYQLPICPN